MTLGNFQYEKSFMMWYAINNFCWPEKLIFTLLFWMNSKYFSSWNDKWRSLEYLKVFVMFHLSISVFSLVESITHMPRFVLFPLQSVRPGGGISEGKPLFVKQIPHKCSNFNKTPIAFYFFLINFIFYIAILNKSLWHKM